MDCRKSLAPLCKYFLLLFILATVVHIFSNRCCLLLIKKLSLSIMLVIYICKRIRTGEAGWPIAHVVDYFLQKSQRTASYTRLFLSFPVCTYKQQVRKQIYPKIRISDGLLAECVAVHWKNTASQATGNQQV